MFTPEQIAQLDANLARENVKQREQSGRKFSYIEGWHAIAEANRIFGYGNWSRETVELRCVSEKPREIGQAKNPGFGVSYVARVRVTVWGTNKAALVIAREGSGSGHGIDRDLGQAHESALKEAETDAMKRALMTFGNPFGLALYDKEQTGVEGPTAPPQQAAQPRQPVAPAAATTAPSGPVATPKITPQQWGNNAIAFIGKMTQTELDAWANKNNAAIVQLRAKDAAMHKRVVDAIRDRYVSLEPMGAG